MSHYTLHVHNTWQMTVSGLNVTRQLSVALDEIKKLSQKLSLATFAAFIVLSLADLILTRILLTQSGGDVYEANPLANLILSKYGWAGMTAFKFGMVLMISGIMVYVAYYQPKTAGRLLCFAVLLMAGVVGYSGYLLCCFV
ncbi:MAG TPA: DUF5658 family protein [Gemmatales bacterium]|nr:DUF5658 family protein [Gemmatales bacterium]